MPARRTSDTPLRPPTWCVNCHHVRRKPYCHKHGSRKEWKVGRLLFYGNPPDDCDLRFVALYAPQEFVSDAEVNIIRGTPTPAPVSPHLA